MIKKVLIILTVIFILFVNTFSLQAQKKERKKEFYFSWGYNKEWYTRSTIKVDQPSLGNKYSFQNIKGHDHPGWDEGIFNQAISIPQYNYRFGLFLNKEKGIAVEINFDHTKYIFADQPAHLKGVMNNRNVDTIVNFARPDHYYYLNNGANFLLFNIVKRWHWYAGKNDKIKIDFLGKAGVGPVIPHVENSFFGKPNQSGFQLGGWNVGVEAAVRTTFYNRVFFRIFKQTGLRPLFKLKSISGYCKTCFWHL